MNRHQRTRPTRQETRERILEGAARAFAERGFHGATIDDICSRAGLTRGAFHSGFGSKEDLFLALYDRMVMRVGQRMSQIVEAVTMEENRSDEVFDGFMRDGLMDQDWYVLQTEFTLYAIRRPTIAHLFASHRHELLETIATGIKAAAERSGRKLNGDPILMARAIFAINDGNLGQHLVEPDVIKPGDLLMAFGAPLLLALSNPSNAPSSHEGDTDRGRA